MWLKQDVLTSLVCHLVCKLDSKIEIKFLEQSFSELREAIRVNFFFLHDYWKSNLWKGVHWQRVDLLLCELSFWLWLVVTPAKEEGSNHVAHQVLRSELDHV